MNNITLRNIDSLFQQQEQHLGQFLDHADFNKLVEIKNELNDTWHKKQIFRTETEMRVSVLNDANFPTAAAKYWQCVREQNVFFENIIALNFEYRKNLVQIKKLQKKLAQETDPLEQELLAISLEEAEYARVNMELVAKDRVREIELWSRLKSELDNGSFDTEDVNAHQMQSLAQQLTTRANTLTQSASQSEVAAIFGSLSSLNKLIKPGTES
jgi:hypothetical protein